MEQESNRGISSASERGISNIERLVLGHIDVTRRSLGQRIFFRDDKFDVNSLAPDLRRVYYKLKNDFGEEYALTFVFMFRTGVELHRAWHITLLTSKILQQLKDKFKIRMTWELGALKLKFRVEDGGYELHRMVPYDTDSEYQDIYMKIAVAYLDGHITVEQALKLQSDTKLGKHTAKSGVILRDFPGRLVLYPIVSASCALLFFGGDFFDAGVAAICGLCAGLVEYLTTTIGGSAKRLIDVLIGISTGAIGGLFYRYMGQRTCMPAIFLGTLYWFFYGIAFVVGFIEIIAGELETGVTRFMAASVKTFVLTLGTAFGMQMTTQDSLDAWYDQNGNCGNIDLDTKWWRIPLYLLCSAASLGQWRVPLVDYWRGLAVQLVGYEVQYQVFKYSARSHAKDFIDTAIANVLGGIFAVIAAEILSTSVEKLSFYYHARVFQRHKGKFSAFGEFVFSVNILYIRFCNWLGFGKNNDIVFLNIIERLKRQDEELDNGIQSSSVIKLTEEEETVFFEAVIGAEDINIWSLLIPTIHQLVPGSLIAKMWFNAIFPPSLIEETRVIEGTDLTYTTVSPNQLEAGVFQNLMVVASSLSVGLLIGSSIVDASEFIFSKTLSCNSNELKGEDSIRSRRRKNRRSAYY